MGGQLIGGSVGAVRAIVVCLSFVLAACATRTEAPLPPWPRDEVPLAPLVVRNAELEAVLREDAALKRAGEDAVWNLVSSVLAVPLYGIGLFLFPLVFVDAQQAYIAERCPPGARDVLGQMPKWVQTTFAAVPAANLVAEEAQRRIQTGAPSIFVAAPGEDRMDVVARAGAQSGAKTVILADVYVLFGELTQGSCALRLVARADVRVQPLGQREVSQPRYHLWAELDEVPLVAWAADADLARDQLRSLLRELGAKLVESYRDRMGCGDRPCAW